MDPTVAQPGVDLFTAFEPLIREIIFGALLFVLMGALELARRHLGLQVTTEHRQAILAGADRVAGAVLKRYGPDLRRAMTVTSDHPAVLEAAQYMESQMPKRLKKMGMATEDVRRLLHAEIERRLDIELPPPIPMTEAEIKTQLLDLLKQYDSIQQQKAA